MVAEFLKSLQLLSEQAVKPAVEGVSEVQQHVVKHVAERGRNNKLDPLQLMNLNRRARRLIGKRNGFKIPGIQDTIKITKR